MPALATNEAAERLARTVENARPTVLAEIQAERFSEAPMAGALSALDLARHVRGGLAAEELVDLWSAVFPADRNVRYDEEDEKIHYNEEVVGYAEAD